MRGRQWADPPLRSPGMPTAPVVLGLAPLDPLERLLVQRLLDDARAMERFQRGVGLAVLAICLALALGLGLVPVAAPGALAALLLAIGWGLGWWFVLHAEDRRRVRVLEEDLAAGRVRVVLARVAPALSVVGARSVRVELDGLGARAISPAQAAVCELGAVVELRELPRAGDVLGLARRASMAE